MPHFRLTSDIGNLWEGYGGPTMGVITTVDVIQAIPDVWGCAESLSVMCQHSLGPWNVSVSAAGQMDL